MFTVEHIGYIVKDIYNTMEIFKKFFGVKNWDVREMAPPKLYNSTCYGEKVKHSFRIAYGSINDFIIELLMPLEGNSVYSKFLKEKGEGLHHICITFENEKELESTKEDYLNQGGKVIQSGRIKKEKVEVLYYYVEKDAIVLELLLRKKGK